ncbi:MAG: ferrous iron transport protein B, partial [Actinomycetia bacterium]|nr:ferrous iron transport protein B [Actinomycetes bacterium]
IIFVTMVVVWLLMSIPVSGSGGFADTDVDNSAFAAVAGVVAPVLEPAGFGSWEATGALMSGFVAKEVVIGTMAQVYGDEEVEVDDNPSIAESLGSIGIGFVSASFDAIKAVPGMIGIDLVGGEEDDAPGRLSASIEASFQESSDGHGALAAVAFMVFILLYTPCMATVGAIRHEIGNTWMWFSVIGQTSLAWVMAVAVFQIGKVLGF